VPGFEATAKDKRRTILSGRLPSIDPSSNIQIRSPDTIQPASTQANHRDMTDSSSLEASKAVSQLLTTVGADGAAFAGALLDMLDRLDAMVAVKDVSTGRYVHANRRMATLLGRETRPLVGATDADLMELNQAAVIRAADHSALGQASASAVEHRLELDGQRREFRVLRLPIRAMGGQSSKHILCVWMELTASRAREAHTQSLLEQLEQQQATNEALRRENQDPAVRDDAMGLYQRNHFDDQLRREADLSAREHRQFALVSIALDSLGVSALESGAEGKLRILEALGRQLRGNTRAMDASCRVADDRFYVLLSGVGLATAHARMEGLRRQCATQIVAVHGKDLGFTVSMGVASFPHTAASQDALVDAADRALVEALRRGGNQVALAGIRFEQN
jgi:diguanylate cyclase (GGDEF)-like protein